jgi:RNA polymerase primary sigma factor
LRLADFEFWSIIFLTMARMRKAVEKLLKEGKERGWLTQEEILEVFNDAEDRVQELDDLFGALLDEGVDVFESVSKDELEEDKGEDIIKGLQLMKGKTEGVTTDPVRMYLKEIGRIR